MIVKIQTVDSVLDPGCFLIVQAIPNDGESQLLLDLVLLLKQAVEQLLVVIDVELHHDMVILAYQIDNDIVDKSRRPFLYYNKNR